MGIEHRSIRDPHRHSQYLLRVYSFWWIQKQILDLNMDFVFLSANPNSDFSSGKSFLKKDSLDLKSITVAIWPREVVTCRDFILGSVATFWVMSLVGIYPGRASKKDLHNFEQYWQEASMRATAKILGARASEHSFKFCEQIEQR